MIKNTGTKVENTPQQSKFPTYKKPSCHVPLPPLTGETDNTPLLLNTSNNNYHKILSKEWRTKNINIIFADIKKPGFITSN